MSSSLTALQGQAPASRTLSEPIRGRKWKCTGFIIILLPIVLPAGALCQGDPSEVQVQPRSIPTVDVGRLLEKWAARDWEISPSDLPDLRLPTGVLEFPSPAWNDRGDRLVDRELINSYRTNNDGEPTDHLRFYRSLEVRRALREELEDPRRYQVPAAEDQRTTLDFRKVNGYFKAAFSRRYMIWSRTKDEDQKLAAIDRGYMAARLGFLHGVEENSMFKMQKSLNDLRNLLNQDLYVLENFARRTEHLRPPPPARTRGGEGPVQRPPPAPEDHVR